MPVYEGTSEQILMLLSLYNDIVITLLLQINYCWKTIDTAFKSKKKKNTKTPINHWAVHLQLQHLQNVVVVCLGNSSNTDTVMVP